MKKSDDKKYMKILMSIFIAFIMITSILGFMVNRSTSQSYSYDGYKFTLTDKGLSLVINKKEVFFDFLPQEVEVIDFDTRITDRIKPAKMFYLTYNLTSENSEAMGETVYDMKTTLQDFDIFVQLAFTNQTDFNVPVITCADATSFVPVVHLKEANETRAYIESNCIVLESSSDSDFLRLKDRLIYGFFGILS